MPLETVYLLLNQILKLLNVFHGQLIELYNYKNVGLSLIGVSDKLGFSELFQNCEKVKPVSRFKYNMNATKTIIFTMSLDYFFENQKFDNQ